MKSKEEICSNLKSTSLSSRTTKEEEEIYDETTSRISDDDFVKEMQINQFINTRKLNTN